MVFAILEDNRRNIKAIEKNKYLNLANDKKFCCSK